MIRSMPPSSRRFVLLIATLLCWTASSVSQALPKAKDKWSQLEAGHFTLVSNAGERQTREIAADLAKFFVVVEDVLGRDLKSPLPSTVYVFRNDSSFKPYKLLWQGEPAKISGYFLANSDANYIAVNADQRSEAAGVLYHELMHYVVSSNTSPIPLWLNEGLAELYSTFESDDGKVAIGKPVERHVLWLRNQRLIPLRELLEVTVHSTTYNEGQRQGAFYAQSWLMVHYLLMNDGGARRTELLSFLEALEQGLATEQAFQQAFDQDFEAFEAEIRGYARQLKFSYRSLTLSGETTAHAEPRALGRHEVLCRLGELLASQAERGHEAEEHFRAGLAISSEAGACHAGLGRVMEAREQTEQALAHYQRATELAPDDFLAWYRWGALQLTGDPDAAQANRATEALHRAAELRPDFAPAWGVLSYAHTFDDEIGDRAIQTAETAHRMLPARADVARNLLHLYSLAGHREPARALYIRFFAAHPDAEHRRAAKLDLLRLDIDEADRLLRAQKFGEAVALLEQVRKAGGGEPELAWLEGQLAEIRAVMKEQAQVDLYNEAVGLLNSGDWKTALGILEQIAKEEPPGEFGEAVRATLAQVRKLEKGAS